MFNFGYLGYSGGVGLRIVKDAVDVQRDRPVLGQVGEHHQGGVRGHTSEETVHIGIQLSDCKFRDVAQLVAHLIRDEEVVGSNPVIPMDRKPIKVTDMDGQACCDGSTCTRGSHGNSGMRI